MENVNGGVVWSRAKGGPVRVGVGVIEELENVGGLVKTGVAGGMENVKGGVVWAGAMGGLVKVGGGLAGGVENVKGWVGAVGGPVQVECVGAKEDLCSDSWSCLCSSS